MLSNLGLLLDALTDLIICSSLPVRNRLLLREFKRFGIDETVSPTTCMSLFTTLFNTKISSFPLIYGKIPEPRGL